MEVICNNIESEADRLYHMFSERPMKHLTQEQWREFSRVTKSTYASMILGKMTSR